MEAGKVRAPQASQETVGSPVVSCIACRGGEELDNLTRELVMCALACAMDPPAHVEEHVRRAMDAGATQTEITGVLRIAAHECPWSRFPGYERARNGRSVTRSR